MLSYECAGIAQAGGLGEAVAGLSRTLVSDYKIKVTVLLPSHGRHLDPQLRERYHFSEEPRFIAKDDRVGTNGIHYGFLSGIEKGSRDGVDYILVKGLDAPTSRWLDDGVLYDHDLTLEKMALFSRTVKTYSEFLDSMKRPSELPDLIHANDWHMVPAGVAIKQNLNMMGFLRPLVFTIHLLSHVSLPWHYASADWCGITDSRVQRTVGGKGSHAVDYRHIWETGSHDSIERFGSQIADYVTSVSQSYLTNDVLSYVGSAIAKKSGPIYNGCDWDVELIKSSVVDVRTLGTSPDELLENRWNIRSFLLRKGLGEVANELQTPGQNSVSKATFDRSNQKVIPFDKDGPMVLMTGRLSPQKGADLLLDSVPLVIQELPETRFVFFLLPSGDTTQMQEMRRRADVFPGNVRIIFAQDRHAYLMSHLSADVYAMPSRSEPFGISALEAMITGNPVVGSSVGGIKETVLDIETEGENGTGLLFPAERKESLAKSLVNLLCIMMIDEDIQRGSGRHQEYLELISSKTIAELTIGNDRLGSKIRQNCQRRVEQNFRWKNAGRTAVSRYAKAQTLSKSGNN